MSVCCQSGWGLAPIGPYVVSVDQHIISVVELVGLSHATGLPRWPSQYAGVSVVVSSAERIGFMSLNKNERVPRVTIYMIESGYDGIMVGAPGA